MRHSRRAFSMVEASLAIVILGVMLGAALETVAASRAGQAWNAEKLRALALASSMMGEVTDQYYVEQGVSTGVLGPDAGENQAVRTTLDDVDDFHGIDGVPTARDGTAIPGLSAWRRTVSVSWVSPGNLTTMSFTESNLKRISVKVFRGSLPLAELVSYRSAAVPR